MTGVLRRLWGALEALGRAMGHLSLIQDPPDAPRMILYAYVCGVGCVRYIQHEGSSTLSAIFIHRPEGCRYAVVTVAHTGEVWVVDLYECGFDPQTHHSYMGRYWTYPTVDAAVMATALDYQD